MDNSKAQFYILSPEELKELIGTTVREELQLHSKDLQSIPKPEIELISRLEASRILGISLPTLDTYTHKGLIQGLKIGRNVRYIKSEVYESLNRIKSNR